MRPMNMETRSEKSEVRDPESHPPSSAVSGTFVEVPPIRPIPNELLDQVDFSIPRELEAEIDELITHYPRKRSASLMLLHAVQERFGFISRQAVEWVAAKLELQPINIYELVTFYPMFHQKPVGKHHLRICRTLSCALGGSRKLHEHVCQRLGL